MSLEAPHKAIAEAFAGLDLSALTVSLEAPHKAIAEAFAGLDLSALAKGLQAERLAVKRALPGCEDFWLDLWAFSVTPLPWGLGLTPQQLWPLTAREWLALYRVWKYHDDKRSANPIHADPIRSTHGDKELLEAKGTYDAKETVRAEATPQKTILAQGRKRGPSTDYKTAAQVAEVVTRIAGKEPWRSKIDDICDELDEKGVLCPKTWKAKEYRSWSTCTERHLVIEAIRHHLDNAKKQATETIP